MELLQDIKEYRDKVRAAQFEAGAKMFLDRFFSNLEVKLSDNYSNIIFYKFNNEIIAYYNKERKYFHYHYYKIYEVLKLEFKLNEYIIYDLIGRKVEEHMKFKEVSPLKELCFTFSYYIVNLK